MTSAGVLGEYDGSTPPARGNGQMEHYKMTLSVELHPLGLDEYLDNIYNYPSNAARLRQKCLWQNTSDLVDAYSQ